MLKICLTGDNHIGKQYSSHTAAGIIVRSRVEALERVVLCANENKCDILAVSGDLFDKPQIDKSSVSEVVKILAGFENEVLVLPGNHDYYTPDSRLWQDFLTYSESYGNITLLNRFEEYRLTAPDGKKITVYPAFCQSKLGNENNLGWIKNTKLEHEGYRIGIAHGAISGLSQDTEGRYFLMTKEELSAVPVDVWLIGHTHVPYPATIDENSYIEGYRIFNAGTHAQTDVSNNTEGCCFIIEIDENSSRAKKALSGALRFYRLNITAEPQNGLRSTLESALDGISEKSVVDIVLSGTVSKDDYEQRFDIYEDLLSCFVEHTVNDGELSELISEQIIKDTFAETSLPAKALFKLLDEPKEAQMLYELLNECKD